MPYKLSYPTYLQIFLFILKTMLAACKLLCDNLLNQIYNLHVHVCMYMYIFKDIYAYEPVFVFSLKR